MSGHNARVNANLGASKRPPARPRAVAGERLGRDDWLDAAYRAVADHGLAGVRVLSLAQALGVTRGSFYWHFADHAALMQALLERWRQGEIESVRVLSADVGDEPAADLLRLLDAALSRRGADLVDMRFELALRAGGRRDPAVAKLLQEVDRARLALFESRFLRLTQDPQRATALAALFYLTVAGANQALARPGTSVATAQWLRGVIAEFLIDRERSTPPARRRRGSAVS